MIYDFSVCPDHIKVEPVRILTFEVAQEGFAETCRFHYSTHGISLEEGVELCDSPIEGLGQSPALEVKVHLFLMGGAVTRTGDQGRKFLGVECSVLDGRVGEPARGNKSL